MAARRRMSENGGVADMVTLKIPRPLYDRIGRAIEGTGFRSVTEFCVYVLRDVVAARDAASTGEMSAEETEIVRRRLHALGYLE
jgi:hypothetical protein